MGRSHSTGDAVSQDNEFNQGDGLKGHWHDVLAAEGSLLTACGQHTSKSGARPVYC